MMVAGTSRLRPSEELKLTVLPGEVQVDSGRPHSSSNPMRRWRALATCPDIELTSRRLQWKLLKLACGDRHPDQCCCCCVSTKESRGNFAERSWIHKFGWEKLLWAFDPSRGNRGSEMAHLCRIRLLAPSVSLHCRLRSTATALTFEKDFSQPEPLPEQALSRAMTVMRGGRIFRYQGTGKEDTAEESLEVCRVEQEFATYVGAKQAMGTNSCGSAMFLALKACGLKPGDAVLVNTFTLHPVPSAIIHAGARPVFVETDHTLCIDLHDLAAKAQRSGAKFLLLSHMRGYIAEMDHVVSICKQNDITLIEDCAHGLGATWAGHKVGSFGTAACFSAQTNKLLNSGEGGFVTTDDDTVAARVILHSGSYGHYHLSGAVMTNPELINNLQSLHDHTANFSLRMTNLTAAILRPQIQELPTRIIRFNRHWDMLNCVLSSHPLFEIPERGEQVSPVSSSFQFWLPSFDYAQMEQFSSLCVERGISLAWFGRKQPSGFTSTINHWRYIFDNRPPDVDNVTDADTHLAVTLETQRCLFDVPLYHTSSWTDDDFIIISTILQQCAELIESSNK